jgi:hypothetical protein
MRGRPFTKASRITNPWLLGTSAGSIAGMIFTANLLLDALAEGPTSAIILRTISKGCTLLGYSLGDASLENARGRAFPSSME